MKFILMSLIKRVGWKAPLRYVWALAEADLRAAAKKTENELDDAAIEILDDMINSLTANA